MDDIGDDSTVELAPVTVFPRPRLGPARRCLRWLRHRAAVVRAAMRGRRLVGAYDDAVWVEVGGGRRVAVEGVDEDDTVVLPRSYFAPVAEDEAARYAPHSDHVLPRDLAYVAPELLDGLRGRLQDALHTDVLSGGSDRLLALEAEFVTGPTWAADLVSYVARNRRLPE